jgi:tetratricopeptide (TPR) repeat protein
LLESAKAYDGLGLYNEAINAGLKTLRFHPNYINGYLRLAYTYLNKGDLVLAGQNARKALDIMPKCDDALFTMGVIKEKQSMIPEAVEYYKKTAAMNKKHAGAYFHLGIISFKSGKLNQAKDYLQKAINITPGMYGANFFLGLIYEALKLPRQAFQAYAREIKQNPNSPDAYVNLGLLYSSEKKWNQAVSLFKQAIKINPNSGAAHINIAVAYYMLGDYPSARTHSKKAKELGLPQADKVLEQLQ